MTISRARRGRRGRRIDGPRLEVAIGEGAANRGERVRRAVEHWHAGEREFERQRFVADLRVVGRDGDDLVRRARGRQRRVGKSAIQIGTVADVGVEQAQSRLRIGEEVAEATGEMGDEIGAGAPGVERIGGFEAGIEPRGDRGLRLRRDRGERDAGAIGEIDQHFPLAPGVADRD